jgi:hypothetical protein
MWTAINNQNELNTLIEIYGGFHDSCVKEIHYISGAYVTDDLAMNPINSIRELRIIFQRQCRNPMEIEVKFDKLIKLKLEPANLNYTCEIHDVSFFFESGMFYWGDSKSFESQREEYVGTWVQAESAKWRVIK